MKCGITGSTGTLGKVFLKKNNKIKFNKFKGDITKKSQVIKWINKNKFNYFIHLASVVPIKKVNKNFSYAKKVNFYGTKYIIDSLIKKKDPIWFFFSSSSHVYSYSNSKVSEKSILKPISNYGKLKLKTEKYLISKTKNTKIKVCIGRIFSFTHPTQKESFFIPSIIKKIKKNKKIDLHLINTYRDFVHIYDICNAIKLLMKKKLSGVFNIGSGKKTNLLKIYQIITKKKINFSNKPNLNLFSDISKIKKKGWKPIKNIYEIISDFKI